MKTRNYLWVLVGLAVVVHGMMFISYPFGGADDDQSAHRYQIERLVDGDLLIGNMRYHTGYPLVIAPVAMLANHAGRFDDRIILLVQVLLTAAIPLMSYDIIRRWRTPREGFIVGLVVLLDPFGIQWAHYQLPNWWIAFCIIAAFWIITLSLKKYRRPLLGTALAGLILGIAALARLNLAPTIAVLGVSFFLLTQESLRQRFAMFVSLGVSSALILVLYTVLIHLPSTGTLNLSCYGGTNLLVSVNMKDIPIRIEDGPATRYVLELMAREPIVDLDFTSASYPLWSIPGSWVTPAQREAFLNQTPQAVADELEAAWTGSLFYHLGPCETDDLLSQVYSETITANFIPWLKTIPVDLGIMLTQSPQPDGYQPAYLPAPEDITFVGANYMGFQQAVGGFYTGQWVWRPGVTIFHRLFYVLHILKILTPLALLFAVVSRQWIYRSAALMLLSFIVALSIFGNTTPRLYAPVYPLHTLLIGGMLAAAGHYLWRVYTTKFKAG